jgi:hypothetical protein
MGNDERWPPTRDFLAPALGDIESASTGEHGTKSGRETAKVLGARPRDRRRHGVRPSGVDFNVARGEVSVEHFGHAIVAVGYVAIQHQRRSRPPTTLWQHPAERPGLVTLILVIERENDQSATTTRGH